MSAFNPHRVFSHGKPWRSARPKRAALATGTGVAFNAHRRMVRERAAALGMTTKRYKKAFRNAKAKGLVT